MLALNWFTMLRGIHVLAGSIWVGVGIFSAAFLIPSIMATGPAGGQVMRVMAQVRRLPVFMNVVMATTLLSGFWLYSLDGAGLGREWFGSRAGIAFGVGALCALATAAIGAIVTIPAVKRLGALGEAIASAGGAPSAEQAREIGGLQRRMLTAARAGAVLLVAAVLIMATAKYL